jgi:hypothetical protein
LRGIVFMITAVFVFSIMDDDEAPVLATVRSK